MRVGLSGKGYEGTFWVMERFYILIGVWVTRVYAFIKTRAIIHLRFIHFTVTRFYFYSTSTKEP